MLRSVFVSEVFVPFAGHVHHAVEVLFDFIYLSLNTCHELVSLVFRELCYTLHLDFQQTQDILFAHFTHKEMIERRETRIDMLADGIYTGGIFKFLVLVDAFLYEYLFKGNEEQLL